NRDHDVPLLINAETGEILHGLMALDDPAALLEGPQNILRITARYNGDDKTLTLPAPRREAGGVLESEIVIDMEDGEINLRRIEQETAGTEAEQQGRSPRSERRPARRQRSERAGADPGEADRASQNAA